ncbi:MAG: hypothetical protein WBN75_03490 [Verrucomicrobiia bacterium]
MKTPKPETKPAETPAVKSVETPLADSWQASVQKGATPGIFPILWRDGFAVGHGTVRNFWRGLLVHKYTNPTEQHGEHAGKKHFWTVWDADFAEDKKTVLATRLRIVGLFETNEQAEVGLPKCMAWAEAEIKKAVAAHIFSQRGSRYDRH